MHARQLLTDLTMNGFALDVHGERLLIAPMSMVNERLLTLLKEHKAELIELLRQQPAANDVPDPLERFERTDRRTCADCLGLAANGRCRPAGRGELPHAAPWFEPDPTELRRCIGYRPGPDDPDQRLGRERWLAMARRLAGGHHE